VFQTIKRLEVKVGGEYYGQGQLRAVVSSWFVVLRGCERSS